MSNAPLLLNTGYYFDDGGLEGYLSGSSYDQLLAPDNPNNKLKITFLDRSFSGTLSIYNGPTGELLANIGGGGGEVSVQSTHYTGALRIIHAGGGWGWRAYITSVGTPTKDISWSVTGTSNYFNIDYSTNSGSTWTNIATNYYAPSGTYAWQIPNTPSSHCRVRITDYQNNVIVDQSNADFTITAAQPFVILDAPNGSESYYPSNASTISWRSAFTGPNMALDFSSNNGSSWSSITASQPTNNGGAIPNQGTFTWTAPNTPSTTCLIKVKDALNNTISDVSNNTFTIKPHIKVTAPNGGENFVSCTNMYITWTQGTTSNYFNIDYSTNNGASWINVINNFNSTAENSYYTFAFPYLTSSQCKVRVRDANDTTKMDISDNSFSITPPSIEVAVLSPNLDEPEPNRGNVNFTGWNSLQKLTKGK